MAKINVFIHLTLDGVMQSPGGPEEDPRGGFQYGGWATPYGDKVLEEVIGAGMKKNLNLLFGHFTYSAFHSYWPHQKNNPFTDVLNKTPKFVVSRKHATLPWERSTLLEGEAVTTVAALKKTHDTDLLILGSGELVRSLLAARLIDELLLTINPIVLGQGKRLFPDGGPVHEARARRLEDLDEGRGDRDLSAGMMSAAMKLYLLSVYQPDGDPPPPEVLAPIMRRIGEVQAEIKAAGGWLFHGGLGAASTSTVARVTHGELELTDGPFTEGKEHLGGLCIVRAPDLDVALEWGGKLARASGLPIEVRPFHDQTVF